VTSTVHRERGSVVLLVPLLGVTAMLALAGVGRLAVATVAQARADTAADAAALAAADELALGRGGEVAASAAEAVAAANGARLTSCDCGGTAAEVVVEVEGAVVVGDDLVVRGRARAEVVVPTAG